jgi:hypothetical protein
LIVFALLRHYNAHWQTMHIVVLHIPRDNELAQFWADRSRTAGEAPL